MHVAADHPGGPEHRLHATLAARDNAGFGFGPQWHVEQHAGDDEVHRVSGLSCGEKHVGFREQDL